MWQKILSAVLVIAALSLSGCNTDDSIDCCLCGSFRYHAPCLIDLETGDMIELDLYYPHETKVEELADSQPEMGTFSFVKLGEVAGTKFTDSKIVELDVPKPDKIRNVALCKECKNFPPKSYSYQYTLADLYDRENKILIPLEEGTVLRLHCYEISVSYNEETDGIYVNIQGILE